MGMKINEKIVYVAVLLFSVIFLFVGNRVASSGLDFFDEFEGLTYYNAVVVEIVDRSYSDWDYGGTHIFFDARITSGARRGDIITAQQYLGRFSIYDNEKEVEISDRVVIVHEDWGDNYHFANYARINYILILGGIFLILVILFAKKKGFNAIVSLGFTCVAVFWVFIPAILSGKNIYIATIIISIFSIVTTLLLVIGVNRKTFSAMLGCLGGVFLAGVLMFAMDIIMGLTGIVDQETRSLLFIPTEDPINLRAIVFAGVIIGAMGAILDVAVSISSSLWEVRAAGGVNDFGGIVKSGINIGKDILGTMLNTLILAYIGSSLSLILLITVHTNSPIELFNMEMIIVEFLRALVGSLGMLLTIPLTSVMCGWLYSEDLEEGSGDRLRLS